MNTAPTTYTVMPELPERKPVDYLTITPSGVRRVIHDRNGRAIVRNFQDLDDIDLADLVFEAQENCANLYALWQGGKDVKDRYELWSTQYAQAVEEQLFRQRDPRDDGLLAA